MRRRSLVASFLGLGLLLTPFLARAQPAGAGPFLFGTVGGAFGDSGETVSIGVGAGYKFADRVGVEFEFAYIPDLQSVDQTTLPRVLQGRGRPVIFPPPDIPVRLTTDGRIAAFTTSFVGDFPTGVDRLRVYVLGGGGVASVRKDTTYGYEVIIQSLVGLLPPVIRVAETGLALTTGGGVEVRLVGGLTVAADVRYLRIFGELDDEDLARVGGRLAYRF
jgi:opacity protein-like surface antigen